MRWVSSRGSSPAVPFIDALFAGTAPDGGHAWDRIGLVPAAGAAAVLVLFALFFRSREEVAAPALRSAAPAASRS